MYIIIQLLSDLECYSKTIIQASEHLIWEEALHLICNNHIPIAHQHVYIPSV